MGNGAEIIAARLHEIGCRWAFGMPGGEVLTLVDALTRQGIRFVLVKHENAGGFMAQASCRATAAPGILVATLGPGCTNAVNAVACALQDRVPMIVLTGRVDDADAATYTHQVIDQAAVFRPVTKGSFTVVDGAVAPMIDKAIALALEGQPGPVHVDVPVQVAAAPQPDRPLPPLRRPASSSPAQGAELRGARELLVAARRPIVIAGLDVLNDGSAEDVAAFAIAMQVPVVTTYNAKGVLSEAYPISIGAAALSPKADKILLPLLARSDCIICIGYDPIEMRVGWRDPWPVDAPVIEIGAAPRLHGMHHARYSFVCDTGAGLRALRDGIPPRSFWPDGEPAAAREALRRAFSDTGEWGAAAVVHAVRKALPPEGVLAIDTGAHRILAAQAWECYRPNTMLQSVGFGTMGCGLPMGIGYKLAHPETPVVVMTGDGGLEMFLGELATVRDLGLPVVIVVFADRSLALIEMKQRSSQYARAAVDFGPTDFVAVAQAMGGVGVEAGDRETLQAAVRDGLARRDVFTLISCPIPERAYDGRI